MPITPATVQKIFGPSASPITPEQLLNRLANIAASRGGDKALERHLSRLQRMAQTAGTPLDQGEVAELSTAALRLAEAQEIQRGGAATRSGGAGRTARKRNDLDPWMEEEDYARLGRLRGGDGDAHLEEKLGEIYKRMEKYYMVPALVGEQQAKVQAVIAIGTGWNNICRSFVEAATNVQQGWYQTSSEIDTGFRKTAAYSRKRNERIPNPDDVSA